MCSHLQLHDRPPGTFRSKAVHRQKSSKYIHAKLGSHLLGQVHCLANRPCWACGSARCQGSDATYRIGPAQMFEPGLVLFLVNDSDECTLAAGIALQGGFMSSPHRARVNCPMSEK